MLANQNTKILLFFLLHKILLKQLEKMNKKFKYIFLFTMI